MGVLDNFLPLVPIQVCGVLSMLLKEQRKKAHCMDLSCSITDNFD